MGDIYHFIDHHNDGNVIGSLVVTPEGLYNIRKFPNDNKKIHIDEDKLYRAYQRKFKQVQKDAIDQYGMYPSEQKFYKNISQDVSFINSMNHTLNKYGIQIDYYPRTFDKAGYWYIDTVFLDFGLNK